MQTLNAPNNWPFKSTTRGQVFSTLVEFLKLWLIIIVLYEVS